MRYLLGDTAAESARRTADLQDAMVERFEPVWRAEISRAMNEMIDAYAVTGSIPHLPDDHERRLSDIWQDMTLIAINAFGGRIVDHGKASGIVLETKSFSEFFQRLALEFVQSEMIRQRIVGIAGTLRRQIVTIIDDGQKEGQTLADIAKALRTMEPAISRRRSDIIARTEIHGASNYGAHEAAKATGLTLRKEWVSVEDYRTRSFDNPDGPAEFSHRAMNGVVVDMDKAFDVPRNDGTTEPMMTPGDPMGSAGNVINCFAPWSIINHAGLKAAMCRKYTGDLVELSFGGPVNLTVTPNHPVLTDRGWIAAGLIVEGDNLFYCGISGDGAGLGKPNISHGSSRADDLYDTAKRLGRVVGPNGCIVNLHGEVVRHDVNIVAFNGKLRDAMHSSGLEFFGDITLKDSDVSKGLLLANRMFGLSDAISSDFSDCSMSSLSPVCSIFGSGHIGGPDVSVGNGWPIDSKVNKARVNKSSTIPDAFSDAVDGVTCAEHFGNNAMVVHPDICPVGRLSDGASAQVVSVKFSHYSGPVYNFESDTGLLVSDGIVNHNCRCQVAHVVID